MYVPVDNPTPTPTPTLLLLPCCGGGTSNLGHVILAPAEEDKEKVEKEAHKRVQE